MGITVGVCVPARDEVHTGFAFDLAKMVGRDSKFRCGSGEHSLKVIHNGWYVDIRSA